MFHRYAGPPDDGYWLGYTTDDNGELTGFVDLGGKHLSLNDDADQNKIAKTISTICQDVECLLERLKKKRQET